MIYYINFVSSGPNYWTPIKRGFVPCESDFERLYFQIDNVTYFTWSDSFEKALIKAKNKYWYAGKRWRKLIRIPNNFNRLCFDDYKYIIGDKIFTKPFDEARAAFDAVLVWKKLYD
jgi:hypothetical protein